MSVPPPYSPQDDLVPAWGRKLTVPCPACTLPTHRHRTMDYDGVTTYRSQAGPDPVRAVDGEERPRPSSSWPKSSWPAMVVWTLSGSCPTRVPGSAT